MVLSPSLHNRKPRGDGQESKPSFPPSQLPDSQTPRTGHSSARHGVFAFGILPTAGSCDNRPWFSTTVIAGHIAAAATPVEKASYTCRLASYRAEGNLILFWYDSNVGRRGAERSLRPQTTRHFSRSISNCCRCSHRAAQLREAIRHAIWNI